MYIYKRNGQKVLFDIDKIRKSVMTAYKSTGEDFDLLTSISLLGHFNAMALNDWSVSELGVLIPSVENIQDRVEKWLMNRNPKVAKAYILYREQRKNARFIKERIDYMNRYAFSEDNAATSSETDANANVTMKNVANLEGEVYKTTNRIIQRQRMKDKLNQMYPEVAKQYEKDLEHHIIYTHDEASTPVLKQYTYSPKESVYAKIDNLKVLCSFETLYELSHAIPHEVEPGVYIKQPNNIFIKDKDGWTKVTCLTKKARHRDLYRVKTSFGEDLIVTDNHPMIVGNSKDETVNAVDSLGYTQFRTSDVPEFGDTKFIDLTDCVQVDYSSESFVMRHETQAPYYFAKRKVEITRELGYAIGFFIGDGNYDNTCHNLSYSQKDRKPLLRIADALFDSFGVCSSIVLNQNNKWILTVHSDIVYDVFRNFFRIKDKAWNKSLPYNLLEFPKEFSAGIIEGIIDSDGTVQDNSINIRLSSREAITQLTILLRAFGYGVANSVQNCPFGQNKAIKTNYTLWGVIFTNTPNSYTFSGSYKAKELGETDKGLKYSTGNAKITNVSKIENCSYLELCDYIYDITTESNTLMCNNLWAHNCMAVSLYPLMTEGVGNIDGVTPGPPNDLQSFSGQITNLTFLLSSQCKGAVAFGEYFVVLNYYIIMEYGYNWYEKLDLMTTTEHCHIKRTVKDNILKAFKQFVWGINQPAGNRSYQSPLRDLVFSDKFCNFAA